MAYKLRILRFWRFLPYLDFYLATYLGTENFELGGVLRHSSVLKKFSTSPKNGVQGLHFVNLEN